MTTAIPVQRSTNWAKKPTGSWSMNWVQINIQVNDDFRYMKVHIFALRYGPEFFQILFTTTRLSSAFSCEDLLISSLHRSANIWTFIYLNHHSNDNWRCGPRRASVWKGGRLPSWFSTVVCQGWCSRGLLETSKLGIFEANCSLASVARGRLSL